MRFRSCSTSNSLIRFSEWLSAFISLSADCSLNSIMLYLSSIASKNILILALNLFNCFTKALIKKSEIIKKRQPRIRAVCVIISAIPAPATAIINKM